MMQILMLAAGMGKRLGEHTQNHTKCMVEVAGKRLVDRAIDAVQAAGIKKLIFVVGYQGTALVDYLQQKYQNTDLEFEFIFNHDYATTNNIYSFFLAKDLVTRDDTILLESDLIYDPKLIQDIINNPHRDLAVIAKYKDWMDGTVVTCADFDQKQHGGPINAFISKQDMNPANLASYYKTVNIYKFSPTFTREVYYPVLEAYMHQHGMNNYYEAPLKDIVQSSQSALFGYEIGDLPWYEIDNANDLAAANALFSDK